MSARRLTQSQTEELVGIFHLLDDHGIANPIPVARAELRTFLEANGFRKQHSEVEI